MTEGPIARWTLVFAIIATMIGLAGIIYAIKTLRAGVESLRLAADESKRSTKVARAQFWVMVRGVLANYDDVHAKLRPDGIWGLQNGEEYCPRGPNDAEEWSRVELYMGMFEYCETLITDDLLNKDDFSGAYKYRLENLVSNAVIVREKLYYRSEGWVKFLDLCKRLGVPIPKLEDLDAAGV